jgi:PAN domain
MHSIGRFVGVVILLVVGWALGVPAAFAGVEGTMELGVDRPGSDVRNFVVPDADPAACSAACVADGTCTAWTFVKPGVQNAQAICWLKNTVPASAANGCCISGVTREATQTGGQMFYPVPMINNVRVDWCVTFATDCGQNGANQFCQTQGYARAAQWTWEYADQTYVIGSNQLCQVAGSCGALRDVTCSAN